MGVKVENAKVVVNRFGSMMSATPEQISKALLASSLGVKNKAKAKCPFRTGNLRRSIHEELTSQTEVTIGTDVEYAVYVEKGTSKMVGRPYLKPALFESKDSIQDRFDSALSQIIKAGAAE